MKFTALLLLLPLTVLGQDFEEPPVLSAATILKPEFAIGVRDQVPTYGGRNAYLIDTESGVIEADGNTMLIRRVREAAAIARLREVSRTDEYRNALGSAVASPLLVAKGLISHPVSSVTGVPRGLWKFMNRAGQGVKERAEGRERSPYEDSNAAQLIGFSKAKRDVQARRRSILQQRSAPARTQRRLMGRVCRQDDLHARHRACERRRRARAHSLGRHEHLRPGIAR